MNRPIAALSIATILMVTIVTPANAQDGKQEPNKIPRVFVAKISAGAGASDGEASLLNDALLVAIKDFSSKFDIRTSQDIDGIMELEAAQSLAGCDVVSCAAEIGDALGADQLVTGQLGRVGNTWLLSLTRTERSTLKALSRTQIRAKGAAPDILFPLLDAQAAEVFGIDYIPNAEMAPPSSAPTSSLFVPLLAGGGAFVAAGVLSLGASSGLLFLSHAQVDVAKGAKLEPDFDSAKKLGEAYYVGSVVATAIGAIATIVGAGVVATAFVVGGEE